MSEATERLKKVVDKIAEREQKKRDIKAEYEVKQSKKALTTAERLERIEKILGIV